MAFNSKKKSYSSEQQKTDPLEVQGFQNWYEVLDPSIKSTEFFLVDYKPNFFYDENTGEEDSESGFDDSDFDDNEDFYEEEYSYYSNNRSATSKKGREVSGVILFFLVETSTGYKKYRSFLRFPPYFYLALDDEISETQINTILSIIETEYKYLVKSVTRVDRYDADDLVFPAKKPFIKIETHVPNSVVRLRDKLEDLPGVKEWREADILYHRRVAIDKQLHIGRWYKATIQQKEINTIEEVDKVIKPPLKIFGYDIETDNSMKEQPDPDKHHISMISCFSGSADYVLVNKEVVDCTSLFDFFVLRRKADEHHSKEWIDYTPIKIEKDFNSYFTDPLYLKLQTFFKAQDSPPIENLSIIRDIIEEENPLRNFDQFSEFLSHLFHSNPGKIIALKKIIAMIETQKVLESDDTIVDFAPMIAMVCETERSMIEKFIELLDLDRPDIIADFNGDHFDFPFIERRAQLLGLEFEKTTGLDFKPKIGIKKFEIKHWLQEIETVASYGCFHLDAFLWTLRYSYLPKGQQGLKAAVQAKLKLIPIGREALWQLSEEENPDKEKNVESTFGNETGNVAEAVAYSGSDSYVTWLYSKDIILDFAFSMASIFPVNASEILTVAAGTLDDLLIDGIGHHNEIVAKKKFSQSGLGILTYNLNVESVAYTGGFVDAPNPGIWRKDIPYVINPDHNQLSHVLEMLPDLLKQLEMKKLKGAKKSDFLQSIKLLFPNVDAYYEFDHKYGKSDIVDLSKIAIDQIGHQEEIEKALKDAQSLVLLDVEEQRKKVIQGYESLFELKEKRLGKIVHLDVTSMYPSQIRQYKIQPSGIVDFESDCKNCAYRESELKSTGEEICAFESPWTARATLRKPCEFKIINDRFPNGICQLKKDKKNQQPGCDFESGFEPKCEFYSMGRLKEQKGQEFFDLDDEGKVRAYVLEENKFVEVSLDQTYLAKGFRGISFENLSEEILNTLKKWVKQAIKGAEINFKGDYPFLIEGKEDITLKWFGFLYLDISQKNSSLCISLRNRFCQKAYDHVADVMDSFFQKRVYHKNEAKRLKGIIKDKKKHGEPVSLEMEAGAKFHDSTQLGLKVPLNSIYGLLGMKGGVHNASIASAGVTTSLSARLIQWAADYLGRFGPVTELDTDGIWFCIPQELPTHHNFAIGRKNDDETEEVVFRETIPVLEHILNKDTEEVHGHKHYWKNNNTGPPEKTLPRILLSFEQDGPYDFQYVQGKKKYIVYDRNPDGTWTEKELTGLETKRRDFSKLHKEIQEKVILKTYLDDFGSTPSLRSLYKKAMKNVDQYIQDIRNGKFDDEYFVLPKTINNELDAYKSKGPDVITGLIMRDDFGYTIEPGTKVELFHIVPVRDSSTGTDLVVIPKIFFIQDIESQILFLRRRGLLPLIGEIKTTEDVRKIIRINYEKYIEDLIGPGKVVERMIHNVAKKQGIDLNKQSTKSLDAFFGSKTKKKKKETDYTGQRAPVTEKELNQSSIITQKTKLSDKENNIQQKSENFSKENDIVPKNRKIDPFRQLITDNVSLSESEPEFRHPFHSYLSYLKKNLKDKEKQFHCQICGSSWQHHECLAGQKCPCCHVQIKVSYQKYY